jgi:hypothetical protein
MPKIYENIETTLKAAEKNLAALLSEYDQCLHKKSVTPDAKQLTHDICVQLKSALDRIARRYWEIHLSPKLDEVSRSKAKIYFPAANKQEGLDSSLGLWRWKSVRGEHQPLYDYLLSQQPFSDRKNRWLAVVNDLSVQGKHIDLVPQTRTEGTRINVSNAAGASVNWNPALVRFGGGPGAQVHFAGAPIDPATQRIVPTSGVTERIEVWVSFVIEGYGVNAGGFCKDACRETRRITQEMTDKFGLS